ncbi:MAG: NfeD family protein [Planctomycetota bacterium]|nr:NfeD family protein [Planctomycetota bacterium]
MPDAAVLATMLLLLGLFLLGLEFFIPSFGMILTIAVISLIVSFWSACKAWWGGNPGFFWMYTTVLVTGIPGSLFGAIAIMQKTSLGNRLILRPPPTDDRKPANPLDEMIGRHGVAQTLLTPGGMVTINAERFHAESVGILIEPQTPVVVVAVRANRIVVRPLAATNHSLPGKPPHDLQPPVAADTTNPDSQLNSRIETPGTTPPNAEENGDRLDFEIPDDYTQLPET